jgi:hypothetical protein
VKLGAVSGVCHADVNAVKSRFGNEIVAIQGVGLEDWRSVTVKRAAELERPLSPTEFWFETGKSPPSRTHICCSTFVKNRTLQQQGT